MVTVNSVKLASKNKKIPIYPMPERGERATGSAQQQRMGKMDHNGKTRSRE